jgi:diacylglycerol kinase (ATP)
MRILLNPSARSGRARKRLRGIECIESKSPSHFQSLVREAEDDGCELLGIAGGDGTVALAVSAIEGRNRVPWKIFPVGSGNDFAAHLSSSPASRVDLGRANGQRFCCVASIGLDALALEIVHRSRLPRSKLLNLYAALRGLIAWQPREVRISWDGGVFEGPIMFAAVTNTRSYAGGFRVSPAARLDDGRLDLCIVQKSSRARLLYHFPKIFRGTHTSLPNVISAQSTRVRIESDAPLPVALDGELPRLRTPVELICEPAALEVRA